MKNNIVYVVDCLNECVAIFTTKEKAEEYINSQRDSDVYCIMPVKVDDYDGLYKEK